ncbi:hypothetical protein MMC16_003927 [Acarospora aff. strigata]|nr:hypothetical protein [Acarospora aff. strigata]
MSKLANFVGTRNGLPTPAQSSANGASNMPAPVPSPARQREAAQARVQPPVTHLGRQPLSSNIDLQRNKSYSLGTTSNGRLNDISSVKQQYVESHSDHGGVFDTDVEGVDDTSMLSELQVMDSQAKDQGRYNSTDRRGTTQRDDDLFSAEHEADNDPESTQASNEEEEEEEEEEEDGSEEEDEVNEDQAAMSDDNPTIKNDLDIALDEMNADVDYKIPFTESPEYRTKTAPQPQAQYYSEAIRKQARHKVPNGVRRTNNSHPVTTNGESDGGDPIDHRIVNQSRALTYRQRQPHKGQKKHSAQPNVIRIPQRGQSHETQQPTAQQPPNERYHRSTKQDESPPHQNTKSPTTQHHARDGDPQPDTETHTVDAVQDDELIAPENNDTHENNDKPSTDSHPPPTLFPSHLPTAPTKRPLELDYEPPALHAMPYSDLATQPFDHNPRAPPSILPDHLSSAPLPSKLQHITTLPSPDDRSTFFSALTLTEWEESGDWFVERFGALVKRMKDARTERRRIAVELEEEVARREEVVRKSREGLQLEMEKMKRGGEDVLRSKMSRS